MWIRLKTGHGPILVNLDTIISIDALDPPETGSSLTALLQTAVRPHTITVIDTIGSIQTSLRVGKTSKPKKLKKPKP
jgi:hypothetical protein